jgi:hypothetical protein
VSGELEILKLRAQLVEVGSTVRQLRQAGLDGAAAELLLSRKRAELEDLMKARSGWRRNGTTPTPRITSPG